MGKLTDRVAKGVFWVLMEKFGLQAVHFVVTLVLARLLTPNDYGTVALLSIFISLSNLFVDFGFGKALVQKRKATQTDMNSVFYLSVSVAVLLYAGLFAAAPWVAKFYRIPELTAMMRVLALSPIFHSINGVQNVELNRKMLFKLSFRISWARSVVSAVTGISLALAGYGPWALVWAALLGGVTGVIARQLVIRWRPTLTFSWQSVKELFLFGWKVALSGLLNHAYSELYGLIIGRIYTRADLAFVKKGSHEPNIIRKLATGTLTRVSFSALSRLQDDPVRLCRAMRKMIQCSAFVIMPPLACLAVVAEPMILLLFGRRWLPCVPYLRIACIACAFVSFSVINNQAIMARGRSGVCLALTVTCRLLGLCVIFLTMRLGVLTFYACNVALSVLFGFFVWAIPNRSELGYSLAMQVQDAVKPLLLSALAAGVTYGIMALPFNPLVLFLPGAVLGLFFAYAAAYVVRYRVMGEIVKSVRPTFERRLPFAGHMLRTIETRCAFREGDRP